MRYSCPKCGTEYLQGFFSGQIVLAPEMCEWCPDQKVRPHLVLLEGGLGKITPDEPLAA